MTETQTPSARASAASPRLVFRVMRVESDYRRDTRSMGRDEREEYSSMIWNLLRMERKPKVAILDIVGSAYDNPIGYQQETPLAESVTHYHRQSDRANLRRVLKFYCAYLMQQARKEADQSRQLFLVFKTVDCARMLVQYSPHACNAEAEALVFGIFHDLGQQLPTRFGRYLDQERTVFNIMKRLQVAPLDHPLRLELAQALNRQTSFFDAVVQYQYLLLRYPSMAREGDTRRGRVFIRLGEIFQNLADHAEVNAEGLGDARKLKNFVERYNRDYAEKGHVLPPLQGPGLIQVKKVAAALRGVSSRWYLRALAVRTLDPRTITRQVVRLAQNYLDEKRPKDAIKLLLEAYPFWRRVQNTVESIPERINYLNMIHATAMQVRDRRRMDWANQEIREHQNRLSEIQQQEKIREERREALLIGDGLSE